MTQLNRLPPLRFGPALHTLWKEVIRSLTDSYRPERYYMRGPGPKWRAKQAQAGA